MTYIRTAVLTLLGIVLLGLIAMSGGCTAEDGAAVGVEGVDGLVGGAGVDLVTEAELLYHAAQTASEHMSLVLAGIWTSHGGRTIWIHDYHRDSSDADWHDDKRITWVVEIYQVDIAQNGLPGNIHDSGELIFHWSMDDSVYRDGTVNVGSCKKLPGGGTATTGEYDVLENDTDEDDSRHIEHKTTESSSSETSLDVTLDLTNNTSVEAGASFPGGDAKATTSFESHLGITRGSVASQESSKERTISDDITVAAHTTQAANFTLDDTTSECDIQIDSTVDWPSMKVDVWRHSCTDACGDGSGEHVLQDHGVISSHGRMVSISFKSTDDVVRLAYGHDPRCDGCEFDMASHGSPGLTTPQEALYHLNHPEDHYRIQLSGKRRSVAKDSASLHLLDITGLDRDCVDDQLGTEGKLLKDIDADGDGVPDACKP